MSDPSSHHLAPNNGRGKATAVKVGICAAATVCLGLVIGLAVLLGILFPSEQVLAVATVILATATLAMAVVAIVQRSRRE
jgi:hypothetical protein